jgi:hypothetical protein
MPRLDGMVVINEGPPVQRQSSDPDQGSWSANGADVTIHLEAGAMECLLCDPPMRL